ncbi:superoxide dismutase [Candidatus Woesearchaeota archaeon]|nr:superoxide dismutase [Candidatus Woesearchaeota archaeon]
MKFELPKLPYEYNALEPHIDAKTMEVHHSKHHNGYTDKFNAAIEGKSQFDNAQAEDILRHLDNVPEEIRTAVRNNGGGYVNHKMFWTVMAPGKGGEPSGELKTAIEKSFGSFQEFKEKFSNAAKTQFGSGWAWLVINNGQLEIMTTSNQDSPLSQNKTPILCIDVWEHAYYLKYQNKRPDYVDAFWNVVNWEEVGRRFKETGSQNY